MGAAEIEKSKSHITVSIIEYMNDAVVIKTILKKTTGSVSVMSFDKGQGLPVHSSPFDTFVQVIDGTAEIIINGESFEIKAGSSIVVPAHTHSSVRQNGRFKLIETVIKSGYEL
jgi:quercetin dioxygenase-like cupin family protein